jgi:peptidoglycan/xylan/chitin deacetylase (PgdA/CDA1 family)
MKPDLVSLIGTHLPRRMAPFFSDLRWRGSERSKRVAHLTFDDGPTAETPRLLEALARYEAQATFFLLGEQVKRFPEHARAIAETGHAVGNHTFAHPDPWLTSARRVESELDRTTTLLENQVGERVGWARPPYGHVTPSMRRWAKCERREIVMWDVMPGDFLPWTSPRAVARRVLQLIRPGSIIVLHDRPHLREVTLPALHAVLERLTAAGWRFRTLR